jgi:hypothetical protein
MKKIITLVASVPVLALFGGIGILAIRIGETWDETTTQSLVTGLTVVCGGGTLLFALLLACLIGVPLAIRAYGEGGGARRQWGDGWSSSWTALSRCEDWPPVPPKRPPPLMDGEWRKLPEPPPWGMTGGGSPKLLPPVEQDERFGLAPWQEGNDDASIR